MNDELEEDVEKEFATIKLLMIFSTEDFSAQIVVFVTIPLPLPSLLEKDEEGIIEDKVSLIGVNNIKEFESSSPINDFHPPHNPDPNPNPTSFLPPIIN